MAVLSADRAALFGALAVQFHFVTSDALAAAMAAWRSDKTRSLDDILKCQGHLSAERHDALMALVDDMVREHGDVRSSLAAMSATPATLPQPGIGQAAVATLPQPAAPPAEPDATPQPRAEASLDPGVLKTRPQILDAAPSSQAAAGSRYRVLKAHKKGGLGEVFVAEDTELGRRVALKEIQTRFVNDTASRTRFVLEAEVTGGLEHPGIVPVYGLGHYADGRPYYAMRFVQGDNLREALGRFHAESLGFDSLAFRQLLRRFVDVCNAVAYAHSRGVLHRDLKPGNVMLGQYGETLLVDWGLAKATGKASRERQRPESPTDDTPLLPRSGGESGMTMQGQAMGTPAYMSPEQARGDFDSLGAAADIYSLGASLYELLTNRVPFPDGDLDAVEAGRFPPPRAVRPSVPRALEAVCLKAMSLKPEDRYGSALDLAKELEQWLADEPVIAWREPLRVRVRRWVRKHARLVTGMTATLAVGLVSLGVTTWQSERARAELKREQAATVKERDRAVAARTRTRQALDAMVSEETGDALTRQKELTAEQKKFLEQVVGYYEEFAAEPGGDLEGRERLAVVHHHLGTIRYRLGQTTEAAKVFDRATQMYGELVADFPAVHEFREGLAVCQHNRGLILAGFGRRPEAEAAYRASIALQEQLAADFPTLPAYRQQLALYQQNLGNLLHELGRLPEAEAAYRTALPVQEKLAADFPAVPVFRRDLGKSHSALALLLQEQNKLSAAEVAYRSGLAVQEKLADEFPAVPEYRWTLALSHHNQGNRLKRLGRTSQAVAAYRTAQALLEKLAADSPLVPEYRDSLAACDYSLGNLLIQLTQRQEAEACYRAALALWEKLAADFPGVPVYRERLVVIHNSFGLLLAEIGNRREAEAAYRAALALLEKLAADNSIVP